jgi:hypothetical protein
MAPAAAADSGFDWKDSNCCRLQEIPAAEVGRPVVVVVAVAAVVSAGGAAGGWELSVGKY